MNINRVIKTNDEVLAYKQPINVHQVVSHHANHAVSIVHPVALLESVKNTRKSVRIKLVVSKKELELMLKKGDVSLDELVSGFAKNGSLINSDDRVDDKDDGKWKPGLESIQE